MTELDRSEQQAVVGSIRQTCVFLGIQDADAEQTDRVFDSVGHRAHHDKVVAHDLTNATRAGLRRFQSTCNRPIGEYPVTVAPLQRLWRSDFDKYAEFAELRYHKAVKKQFKFLRPNQMGLIIRHHRFNAGSHRATIEQVKLSEMIWVSSDDILSWTNEERKTDLDGLVQG